MKTEHKAIAASIGFGVLFWIADAVLDTFFFYEGPFIELLITDVPPHELYIRCVGLAGFVVFGILMSSVLAKHRRAEEARAREEAELRATLYSIGDAVIATDVEGRVTRINPVAERLTGWAEDEAVGRPLEEIFPIVNEETHQPVENPVARVLREGSVVGLANHTLLISRDGREIPIADAAAPIFDAQEDITGVVLVFRDQTDERLTQRLTQTRLSLIEYAAHHTLDELLTRAVDEVSAYVNSPIGFYHFVDPDQKTLSLQQWSTRTLEEFCPAEGEGMHYRIDGAGVWADCVREKGPVIHNDYASLPHKKGMPKGHTTVIRELVVPVMREDKVVAILGVGNKAVDYTEHDAEIVSYLADVTWEIARQKRAEDTLRESEKKYRYLFENAPVGIFHTNSQGQPVAANAAMARMLGLDSPEEALAHYSDLSAQLYVDPKRREEFLHKLQAKGSVENFIYQANTADGRTVWLSMNARAESSPGDSAFHIEGFTTDITDQVEAEERLREALTQLEGIKRHSPDLITMMDREGRYLMINQATADLLGRDPEQIVGRTFAEVLPPEMAETFIHRLKTVFETEQPLQIEDDVPQEEGASVYTTTLFPVFDQNDFCYAVGGIARDVTKRLQTEETLRESLSQLNAIIQASPLAIISLTPEGIITMWNVGAEHIFGWTAQEAVGRLNPIVSAENQEPFRQLRERVLQGESLSGIEITRRRKDGSPIELSLSTAPLRDNKGHITGIMSLVEDITQRVQAEQALRESEEKFRRLFNDASVGIALVNREGVVIAANEADCRFLGYPKEELVGMHFSEFTHPDDLDIDQAQYAALTKGEIDRYQIDKRYIRKDSAIVWGRLGVSLIRGEDATPKNTVVVCEDITERVAGEKEREQLLVQIQEQARQLRDVMSTVPDGVLLLDTKGRLILANPVAQRYLALLSDTPSGDTITHLGDRSLADLLTSPPSGMWHEVKEGTRTFEVIARPVANGPEPEKWVLVIQDVTEERTVRRRTELQERLASVGQLAAGIAHDFNNLISVIALYAQMGARDTELPPRHQERSSIILEQTERAKELVQQVLDFSRRAVLDRQPMDLLLFMKEQVHLLERTIPEDIDIHLDYRHNEYLVSADPTRMQQVVMNLAVNARDAMPHGGQLDIELEHVQVEDIKSAPLPGMTSGHWIRMTMRDTGEGIPTDVLPHIFEPFFTTKASGEGTGLGLAQVWGILKQHEGFIDVESSEGEGTTFTLYLPTLPAQQAERLHTATEDLPQGEGQVILVVEDNVTLRAALTESLETVNYRALEAANGHEALDILGQHAGEISLILSDMVMPGMGGQALFYAMEERNLMIPMIMMSGHPMESELKRLQEHGLAGWMLKPPDIGHLLRLVAQTLQGTSDERHL